MPALTSEVDNKGDALILDLQTALATANATVNQKTAIDKLQRYALSKGFTSKQCQHMVNLALYARKNRGPTEEGIRRRIKPPKASNAIAILKCVVPAPKAKIGKGVILSVLAALGPSPGTIVELEAGIIEGEAQNGLGPERVKLDLRVQAASIRLLSMLLDSPPVPLNVSASLSDQEQPSSELTGSLPTSYMALSARTLLEKCYGVLFHFLDYQALRPHLCYLLCRSTKRKHVKRYRITKLMSLRANTSQEAGLSALLSTYANFYPDLLFPELLGKGGSSSGGEAGRVPGLKYPDTEWLARVLQCHAKHARRENGETIESDDEDASPAAKKARVSLGGASKAADVEGAALPTAAIPNLVTVQPESSLKDTLGATPSLITELSSLRHLAHSLDRLTLPSQVAAMLGPNYGARLMKVAVLAGATVSNDISLSQGKSTQLAAEDHCWLRLSDWLESVMREEIGVGQLRPPLTQASLNHLAALLTRARKLFDLNDEIPRQFEATICEAIRALADMAAPLDGKRGTWSSAWDDTCRIIIAFIPLIKPARWVDMQEGIIQPLSRLATCPLLGDLTSATVMEASAGMLRQWGARNWIQYKKRLDRGRIIRWGITNLDPRIDYLSTISNVISSFSSAVIHLMGLYPQSIPIEHASLTLYEVLAAHFAGLHGTPPPDVMPFWTFSTMPTSIMTLSRACGLMRLVRGAYQEVYEGQLYGESFNKDEGNPDYFTGESTTVMNGSVTLMADIIWRGKGLTRIWDKEVAVIPPGYHS